ncbi:RlpA-like double-psi beta-barrel-protein domain-containing protein-containing protein [Mycena rebaudengoi]|nr:RlpA-like double-psi beta-barrel-protein domain-containing protein-containing protein [Mycena rebaudengoi]
MHFSNLFRSILAAAVVAIVAGNPIGREANTSFGGNNGSAAQKRAPGGVLVCDELNWSGTCSKIIAPLASCIQLGEDWYHKVASFGPDDGAICTAYSEDGCSIADTYWTFQFPGDASGGLSTDTPWEHKISSFQCQPTFTGEATQYQPNGAVGACGWPLQNEDFIVALSEEHYDEGARCGQQIYVEYKEQIIAVTVADLCSNCSEDGINLSAGAFFAIENTTVGQITVHWTTWW